MAKTTECIPSHGEGRLPSSSDGGRYSPGQGKNKIVSAATILSPGCNVETPRRRSLIAAANISINRPCFCCQTYSQLKMTIGIRRNLYSSLKAPMPRIAAENGQLFCHSTEFPSKTKLRRKSNMRRALEGFVFF